MDASAAFDQLKNAVNANDIGAAQALLSEGKANPMDKKLVLFHNALKKNYDEMFLNLVEDPRVDVEAHDFFLFAMAIKYDRPVALKALIYSPHKVTKYTDVNELFISSLHSKSIKCIRMLFHQPGFDPAYNNNMLLYNAVLYNNAAALRKLLSYRQVNPAVDNSNIFIVANQSNSVESVEILLQDGRANPVAKNSRVFKMACADGRLEIVKLLAYDDRINFEDNDFYAIYAATENKQNAVVHFLIDRYTLELPIKLQIIRRAVLTENTELIEILFANRQFQTLSNIEYAESFALSKPEIKNVLAKIHQTMPIKEEGRVPPIVAEQTTCSVTALPPKREALLSFLKSIKYDNRKKCFCYLTEKKQKIYYQNAGTIASGSFGQVDAYKQMKTNFSGKLVEDSNFYKTKINGAYITLPQSLAVKRFKPNKKGSEEARAEAKIIHLFEKKNSKCIDLRIAAVPIKLNDEMCVIMEKMDGSCSKRKFEAGELIKITAGILRGLRCFLSLNLMYSDLKPGNIMYRCEGGRYHVYFGDYGSASVGGEKAVFTLVPFMAWPEEYYVQYPPGFGGGFECKEWHLIFLTFMTVVLMWKNHEHLFSIRDMTYMRHSRGGYFMQPSEAKITEQHLIEKYQGYLEDRTLKSQDERRFLHIMRLCFHARTTCVTIDDILLKIDQVESLYI